MRPTLAPVIALALVSGALGMPVGAGAGAQAAAEGDAAKLHESQQAGELVTLQHLHQQTDKDKGIGGFFASLFKPKVAEAATTTNGTTPSPARPNAGGNLFANLFRGKGNDANSTTTGKGTNFFATLFKGKAPEGGNGVGGQEEKKKKNVFANILQGVQKAFKDIADRGRNVLQKFFGGGKEAKQGTTTKAEDFEDDPKELDDMMKMNGPTDG
ncbi:hypothetical protein XA68_18067 [Ophiocordyceps unilateralis]|uniref:Uncharacterized protein n=1 Tax=Ophiocordyceps unilateralis TaxID=268505 RepID=A0A2A9P3W6_OPHUN|nr:hypothetical protein XA68_18067 [Ophiocordyceps unilateralis]